MTIILLYPRSSGKETCTSLATEMGEGVVHLPSWRLHRATTELADLPAEHPKPALVRWGATRQARDGFFREFNMANAVNRASNKLLFRMLCKENGISTPATMAGERFRVASKAVRDANGMTFPVIMRPRKHSGGRDMYYCHTMSEVSGYCGNMGAGWYVSAYAPKQAEYRVYIVNNRVAFVAEKQPPRTTTVAWNHSGGAIFNSVRWGSWPMNVVALALKAFYETGLDFGGVDVMVYDGKPMVLEINSSPRVESPYRLRGFAILIRDMVDHGRMTPLDTSGIDSVGNSQTRLRYQDLIHPYYTSDRDSPVTAAPLPETVEVAYEPAR